MYLMHPETGSIDAAENWRAEIYEWSDSPTEFKHQYASLVEVVKVKGEWVESR